MGFKGVSNLNLSLEKKVSSRSRLNLSHERLVQVVFVLWSGGSEGDIADPVQEMNCVCTDQVVQAVPGLTLFRKEV
jgi:hypothetical protein